MDVRDCPPSNDLDSWALGNLSEEEAQLVQRHVESCRECRALYQARSRRRARQAAPEDNTGELN